MDLRKLRHMVTLSEELNFARAARKVHLTQSALSRSIQSLEEELGGKLFDRDLQGVALTAIGRQVLKRARTLLADAGNLQHEVLLMQKREMGNVKFGAGPFPGATFLPPILAELARDHPRLEVEIEINNWEYLLQHLLDERMEFFVAEVRSISTDHGVTIARLARQYGGVFCRATHPLTSIRIRHAREILDYPLTAVRMPTAINREMANFLEIPETAELSLNLVCDNPNTLNYVALNSDSILFSTYAGVSKELAEGAIVALELPNMPVLYADMGIVSLTGRSLSPTASWLVERMLDHAQELSDQFASAAMGKRRDRRA